MMDESRKIISEQIARHYGLKNRLFLLMEECGELTQASSKMIRTLDKSECPRGEMQLRVGSLIEEVADVRCLLDEVLYLLGIDWKAVEITMDKKYERTNKLIGEEIKKALEEKED